jgi:hypothetical protein
MARGGYGEVASEAPVGCWRIVCRECPGPCVEVMRGACLASCSAALTVLSFWPLGSKTARKFVLLNAEQSANADTEST